VEVRSLDEFEAERKRWNFWLDALEEFRRPLTKNYWINALEILVFIREKGWTTCNRYL